MGDFDQAERYAIKRLDAPGCLRWLLVGLDPDLEFSRWLETQLAPFPGEPGRRPDCVAELVSRSGRHPPWACLVEPQGQSQADFLVRVVQYLTVLHGELRTGWRDRERYQMMAAIINVGEGRLQTAIDWRPPGVVGVGLTAAVWVRNVYDEPAAATLEDIAAGRVGRCVLPWVAAMAGGDKAEVIARWKELADQESDRELRRMYAGLAQVFADKRRRGEVWETALEGWDVEESTIVNKWRADAMRKMLLRMMRMKFGGSLPPEIARRVEEETNRDTLTRWGELLVTASSEQVQAAVMATPNAAG